MKKICLCLSLLLMNYHLLAQVEEKIDAQIVALEDSVKVIIEQYGEQSEEVVNAYFDLLNFLYGNERYNDAIKPTEKCLDVCLEVFGEINAKTAFVYSGLGGFCLESGDYTNAEKYYEKTLKIRLEVLGEMDSLSAESYSNLGTVNFYTNNLIKSLKHFQKALEIQLDIFGEEHTSTASTFNNIGTIYDKKGDYKTALEYYKRALDTRLKLFGSEHHLTAISFNNIGYVYNAIGDYNKSLEYYEKTLAINLKLLGKKHSLTATSFNNIGNIYDDTGHYSKALKNYTKALEIRLDVFGEIHPKTAVSYSNIGSAYRDIGNYSKSLEFNQKALEIRLEIFGENHPYTARSFDHLGGVYSKIGDYYRALKYHEKSLDIRLAKLGEKHPSTANPFNNLGAIYLKKADYVKALESHQKALSIALEVFGKNHPYTATSLDKIGFVYSHMNNYTKALENHQKALAVLTEILGEKHLYIANSLENISFIYQETGDYNASLQHYQEALSIKLEIFGEKHPEVLQLQINLAKIFETLNRFDQSDSLWNITIPNIKDQLGKNYLFLPDDKKLLYLKTTENSFNSFYNFATKNGSEASKSMLAGLLINNKSQILDYGLSTRQLIENINDKSLDSINFQLDILNQKVAKAELLSKAELKEKGLSLDSLRFLQDDLAAEVLKHPQLKARLNPPKYSWQQIQEKLKPNEASIDYFTFYDKEDSVNVFYAMLLKKDEAKPLFIPISKTKPVEDLLELKDNFPTYLNFKEARQELYGYLWQTLEPRLENINIIHLTPVAALNKIDFESLQNKEGQYLADLYDFHYYSSSKDFYKQQQTQPNYTNATLYGHIAYYKDDVLQYEAKEDTFALRLQRDTLRPLPATLYEVKAIEKICKKSKVVPTLLTIDAAKEDTVEYFSGDRSTDIMHFATHGAYLPPLNKDEALDATVSLSGQDRFRAADNPLQRSLLMLSNAGENWKKSGPNIVTEDDGILTALEVTNLDLSNTELVVLSACNSGIGSEHAIEGVFGLPRAFKLAGAHKILVSLWPVEDETTKELMIEFYTNLLRKKQDAANALRNAKAKMRKRNNEPKKWAGFVLVE